MLETCTVLEASGTVSSARYEKREASETLWRKWYAFLVGHVQRVRRTRRMITHDPPWSNLWEPVTEAAVHL
jgi:hypothetical protein